MDSEQAITERKQLNIEIAKALGYRVVHNGNLSSLFMPDGETLYRCGGTHSEESMFHDVFAARMIPNYAKDLNAASELLMSAMKSGASEDYTVSISPSSTTDEWSCWFEPRYKFFRTQEIIHYAPTPALAVCKAWIQWKRQEGGGDA